MTKQLTFVLVLLGLFMMMFASEIEKKEKDFEDYAHYLDDTDDDHDDDASDEDAEVHLESDPQRKRIRLPYPCIRRKRVWGIRIPLPRICRKRVPVPGK